MVPSGPPTPAGEQPVPPSLLCTNSGILGAQAGTSIPSQQTIFPFLLSPRSQYNNMNLLSNISNVSSLLTQSFGSGGSNSGISGSMASLQHGGMDVGGAKSDPLSGVGSGMDLPHQLHHSLHQMLEILFHLVKLGGSIFQMPVAISSSLNSLMLKTFSMVSSHCNSSPFLIITSLSSNINHFEED